MKGHLPDSYKLKPSIEMAELEWSTAVELSNKAKMGPDDLLEKLRYDRTLKIVEGLRKHTGIVVNSLDQIGYTDKVRHLERWYSIKKKCKEDIN